jgi:hypothetical protein
MKMKVPNNKRSIVNGSLESKMAEIQKLYMANFGRVTSDSAKRMKTWSIYVNESIYAKKSESLIYRTCIKNILFYVFLGFFWFLVTSPRLRVTSDFWQSSGIERTHSCLHEYTKRSESLVDRHWEKNIKVAVFVTNWKRLNIETHAARQPKRFEK